MRTWHRPRRFETVGSRPQEIRNNQPGFSIGGPIVKNKTFFFVSGEIQLAIAGESILDTLAVGGLDLGR